MLPMCQTPISDCPIMAAVLNGTIPVVAGKPAAGRAGRPSSSPAGKCAAKPMPLSSAFGRFIAERCNIGPDLRVGVQILAAAVAQWYRLNLPAMRLPDHREIGKAIKRLSPEVKVRRNQVQGRFYQGLALRPENK